MLAMEPRLPYELEWAIFEDAAKRYRESIPTMLQVSRRVKEWMEQILYSVVIRHEETIVPASYYPPIAQLPSYAHHVRSLLIYFGIEEPILRDHLKLCTNLTDVALWCDELCPNVLELLSALPLQHLTIQLSAIFLGEPYVLQHHVLPRVTHLELLDLDNSWARIGGFIESLKSLTHLALNRVDSEDVVLDILEHCPELEVLVLYESHTLEETEWISPEKYPKVVFGSSSLEQYVIDWVDRAENRACFWDVAEEKVRSRGVPLSSPSRS